MIDKCEFKRSEIINLLTDSEDKIKKLAQNRYGNYVLQKCLKLVEPSKRTSVHLIITKGDTVIDLICFSCMKVPEVLSKQSKMI